MNALSIFIVEDEIITARSIAKNIQKFGYQLAGIATSGSEAILQILKTKPDLVLIDIFLEQSGIDGIAVATKIQSHFDVPILYLTAHSDRETLERAKITTPSGYILKPYSTKNLQISIELALHKHQQDQKVVKREKILTTIFNATQDGVVATDEQDRVIYMNPMAESLTKSTFTTTNDPSTAEIVQLFDERTQQISEPIQDIMEQGEVLYLEESAILLKQTSKAAQIDNLKVPKLDRDPQKTSSVLIFARPKSEINNFNHKPGIANDQLLEDLQAYLIDFILHELRTPLTVILTTAQSLESYRQKWTVEKQDKSLQRIQQAIGQIRGLLDNVAIWNELEKGDTILNPDWFNLVTLSQDIFAELKIVDVGKHQLQLLEKGNSRMVWLDKDVLRSIIVNLLLNGLKYSPQGTVVSLSLEFRSNEVIIKVSDRGIGIPLKQQTQIFEAFYRADNVGDIKGTGLGLAIVKTYIQLCGGAISLSTTAQPETIFTVSLPLKK